jgi:hypothetical protein
MSKHAAEFVALVTDGQAIDGYGERCEKCGQPTEKDDGRKAKFLKLGRAVMKDLVKELGLDPKEVRVNEAGPAGSGEVYLWHIPADPDLYVNFSVGKSREGGFLIRRGDVFAWPLWGELLDLPKVAKKISALRPSPGIDPEEALS